MAGELTVQNLSHNVLTSIPKEVAELSLLVRLDISSNPIQSIPGEVGYLDQLHELNIRNCPNLRIPFEIVSDTVSLKEILKTIVSAKTDKKVNWRGLGLDGPPATFLDIAIAEEVSTCTKLS